MSARILGWRPKTPKAPAILDPTLLWTMHKQQWRIDCLVHGGSDEGWSVRVLLNGRWFFCCRFTTWNEAIQAVAEKRTELEASGWTPAAAAVEHA